MNNFEELSVPEQHRLIYCPVEKKWMTRAEHQGLIWNHENRKPAVRNFRNKETIGGVNEKEDNQERNTR